MNIEIDEAGSLTFSSIPVAECNASCGGGVSLNMESEKEVCVSSAHITHYIASEDGSALCVDASSGTHSLHSTNIENPSSQSSGVELHCVPSLSTPHTSLTPLHKLVVVSMHTAP